MTLSWRVELTTRAAASFRELPRDVQQVLAGRIDRLALEGLPADSEPVPGADPAWHIEAAGYRLICAVRRSDRELLIIGVEPAKAGTRQTVVRTIRYALVSLRGRRTIGRRSSPGHWWTDFAQDVTYAIRIYKRNPWFTLAVVMILALGIGANTALFSVANNVFLRDLPFVNGDRLVRIRNFTPGPSGEQRRYNVSPVYFHAIRDNNDTFEDVVAAATRSYSQTGGSDPQRVSGISVSENWGPMLGVRPTVGRYFSAEEDRLGEASRVVVLSHGSWVRSFGGESGVLDESIVLDGRTYRIIGVMPPAFRFPYSADLWLPGTLDRSDARSHSYNVLARLKPGVSIEQAQADLDRIAGSVANLVPGNENIGLTLVSARDDFVQDDGEDRVVMALSAAVGFLLLIACVNVANLLLARFSVRQREIAIRAALGAGGGRQLRQFLTETVLLFMLGGLGGLLLTWWMRDYLALLIPSTLSEQLTLGEIETGGSVAVFAAAISVVAGLLFGAVAAWRSTRYDVTSALKAGGRTVSGGRKRAQRTLIVAEVALALILLMGAGLMIQNFQHLQSRDLGFNADGLLTYRLELGSQRYASPAARAGAMRDILARTQALPGVVSAGSTSDNPICCGNWGAILEIDGDRRGPEAPPVQVFHRYVTPGFFEAMGIPLVRGRVFTDQDDDRAEPSVIIDERMAGHFWPNEDPIGKRVRNLRGVESQWRTVIGVVGTVHDMGDYRDTWYLPFYGEPTARATENLHVMVRTSANPTATIPGIRQAIREVDSDLAIFGIDTMIDIYNREISRDRLGAVIAALFGGFGVVLAAFGIYGVMSFIVSQRIHEIGMRMALGAQRRDVVVMVLGQSLRSVVIGTVIGMTGALGLNRVLASLIADLRPIDLGLLVAVAAILFLVATVATLLPVQRASRIEPMRTFRV